MVRSVLAHHLHQRFSDAETGQLAPHGRTAAFQTLVVRHWPAVVACLHTCFKDRAAVLRGTEQVFSDLYDATVGKRPLAGSLRVHLLTTARTPAPREWNRAPKAWGDTPDAEGAARTLTDGSLPGAAHWPHAPTRPSAGVHTVYLTACCAAGNSCVGITEFTFS